MTQNVGALFRNTAQAPTTNSDMRLIFKDVDLDDLILAARAIKWLAAAPSTQKAAILAYGEEPNQKAFYVCRNKASITVRPC